MTPDKKTENLEFFAIIKLVTNEEIIGFVTLSDDLEEGDEGFFYITDPLVVKPITIISNGRLNLNYHLSPWMVHSQDTTFHVNQKDVVVWGDMSQTMLEYYNMYINSVEYNGVAEQLPLDNNKESPEILSFKSKLEKLYNL